MKRIRFFIIGIILLALTIGMAKANYDGLIQEYKQSTANPKIIENEVAFLDDGSNTTFTDDDWTIRVGTGPWVHEDGLFKHKKVEYGETSLMSNTFSENHTITVKWNPTSDGGANAVRFQIGTSPGPRWSNGYLFSYDHDTGATGVIACYDGTNAQNTRSLPTGLFINNQWYILRFISNQTTLLVDMTQETGENWTRLANFSNCSTSVSNDLIFTLYDNDASLHTDSIYLREHNGEGNTDKTLFMAFEQQKAIDESMYSRFVNETSMTYSYDEEVNQNVATFDGAASDLRIKNARNLCGSHDEGTIIAYVKNDQDGTTNTIFTFASQASATNYLALSIRTNDSTSIASRIGGVDQYLGYGPVLPDGEWHMVTWTKSGTTNATAIHTIYIDDVPTVMNNMANHLNASSYFNDIYNQDQDSEMTIGNFRRNTNANYFKGDIGIVEIYHHALTAAEVADEYQEFLDTMDLRTVTQGTNLSAISLNGTTVEGWYMNGSKISSGDTYVTSVADYQRTICANMTNPTDSVWTNCVYVNQYGTFSIINLTSVYGLEGTNITENITMSHLGNNITGDIPLSLYTDIGAGTLLISPTGWINKTTSLTTLNLVMHNATQTATANAELNFIGNVSGDTFYPQCTLGGSLFNNAVNEYEIPSGTNTIICEEDTDYQEMSFSVIWNQTDYANDTFELGEYYIVLNFTANTSGNVVWTQPNDDGDCCQIPSFEDTADYNQTIFQWIKVSSQFQQDDLVSIRFNNQTNDTLAQYYEFYNDRDTIRRDHVGVLTTLDYVLWVNVYNYGNDELYEATVTVYHYPNETYTDGFVVQKRITRPMLGDARPGVPVYLDKSIDYHIVVTADGYQTETVHTRGIDLENNEPLDFKLRPNTQDIEYDWLISGQSQHSNESILIYTISTGDQSRIYWDTDINPFVAGISLEMGGGTISLTRGIHYSGGTDFDLRLYSYNSTLATYVLRGDANITYVARGDFEIQGQLTQNNNIIAFLLFIALIAISSILGSLIKMNGADDTGYYIFGFGSIVLAIVYTQLLPMAGIIALGTLGSAIINTTKD